ncbi:MAG: ABC-ATPase domain-containing protein, partial [Clostridium sp.]
IKIKTLGKDGLSINREDIDLRSVEQIVDREQVTAIGNLIKFAEENIIDNNKTLIEVTDKLIKQIEKKGLISINTTKGGVGNLSMPRRFEIMAAFNRYRKLRVK